jgi:hypothetical protein
MLEFGHELTITIANCRTAQFGKAAIHNIRLERPREAQHFSRFSSKALLDHFVAMLTRAKKSIWNWFTRKSLNICTYYPPTFSHPYKISTLQQNFIAPGKMLSLFQVTSAIF